MNQIGLAAILVADLRGYSRPKGCLQSGDVHRLSQQRNTLCERISSHGGRVSARATWASVRHSVIEDIPMSNQADIDQLMELIRLVGYQDWY